MALGYAIGSVYAWDAERRRKWLFMAGAIVTAAFVLIRLVNVYGDPSRWSYQESWPFTVLSFLNTTKYPPSLLFLLMTLGPALIILALTDRIDGRSVWQRIAIVYGRVPMFYYLLQFPLIHVLAVVMCYARYGQAHWMFESPTIDKFPFTQPPGWGFSLPIIYLIWASVVIALYPLCRWFAALKQRRSDAWLSYL